MEFLKEILGGELFNQFATAINAHNGNEANKDNQVKLANLASGEYVGKGKHDSELLKLQNLLNGKTTELDSANNLIAELQKSTKGNKEAQEKITGYETQVAELQRQLAETEADYAFNVLLMDEGVKDAESREFLIYKYKKKLTEEGKTLELDENKHIKGGDDIVSGMKTQSPTMFESKGTGDKKILGDNKLPIGDGDKNTVTKEDFAKMGYKSRVELKANNPELYSQLSK
ncbi:MAG: hypothetical protein IKW21_02885 [Lachnospiraceae bacterium]|nr:hypothetical protein [Lachnospiraceae bacterium]